jgi:phage terminase large subunit
MMLLQRCIDRQGTRAVCIREVQKSLEQSVKRLLEDLITSHGLEGFRILDSHIDTPGGGIIIFQGMQNHTADSIKSLEGYDIAWVEEAQSLSQHSLDLLRPTLRKPDSELWFTWNPRFATDPIDVFLRSEKAPTDSVVLKVTYKDNPHLPAVLQAEIDYDRSRDVEKFEHVWGGGYEKHSVARVFRNWRVEAFETPEDSVAEFLFGGDFGFSNDPDVLVRGYIVGNELRIDSEAYRIGCEIDDTPVLFKTVGCTLSHQHPTTAGEAKLFGECNGSANKYVIVLDSARPEHISYLVHHGFPRAIAAKKGAGSVEEGIKFLKKYDIVVHPRCVHAIDELTHYSYKVHSKTGEILPVLEDKKNHVIDSLRYMVEPVRNPVADFVSW